MIETLYEINQKTFNLEDVAVPPIHNCSVIFEIGIAENNYFCFLDDKEKVKILKMVIKPLSFLDFFCCVCYYKKNGKPLKFDYYLIRFTFFSKSLEVHVFHERGPRYLFPEDIISFFVDNVNKRFSHNILKM